MRVTFSAFVLVFLGACVSARSPAASPWVEFRYTRAWSTAGSIKGEITSIGAVHVEAIRASDGRRISFEKQLRPAELGQIRNAIATHLAQIGQSAEIRTQAMDADALWITVRDGESVRVSFHLVSICSEAGDEREYVLWNALMRATRAPEYDTRDHIISCR